MSTGIEAMSQGPKVSLLYACTEANHSGHTPTMNAKATRYETEAAGEIAARRQAQHAQAPTDRAKKPAVDDFLRLCRAIGKYPKSSKEKKVRAKTRSLL